MSFLTQTVEHIIQNFSAQTTAQACLVLPTRRACFEVARIFRNLSVDYPPAITHIEQFIPEIYYQDTKNKETNAIILLLELFDIFSELEPETSLEKFTSWGYILLKDFDQIDRHLVDATNLFNNLYDIKNLERWSPSKQGTEKIDKYFKLWENLEQTYLRFKELLRSNKQSYAGMMYRALAENVEQYFINQSPYQYYFFVGFNYLSKAEEKIIQTLVKMQKATFLTDTDSFYMQHDKENKAGTFLKRYKNSWLKEQFLFENQDLMMSNKHIQIISTTNATMQGKIANQLLQDWQIITKKQTTAIVLADENLLLPVIHAIDKTFEGMNITMGLPLKNSALFNFIDILFEQHQTRYVFRNEGEEPEIKFNYKSIMKLLNHPFVRQFERKQKLKEMAERENITEADKQSSLIQDIIFYINQHNRIYLSQKELVELTAIQQQVIENISPEETNTTADKYFINPEPYKILFESLFIAWKNPLNAIQNFEDLMDLLNPQENIFEAKYFEQFMDIIHNLKAFILKRKKSFNLRTFRIFLYQAFREASVPLDNDENTVLQVMGMLETRTLDFENVIILSVNENVLPKSKKLNSFIPLDISISYGLPTYMENDAIISYHFFRLLQRSKQIALVHVLPSDTYGGYEKSRFIHQIENNLKQANANIKIENKQALVQRNTETSIPAIAIPKTAEILEKIYQKFEKGLTPSHINSYVACALQYYFNQIAEINSSSVADENLDALQFGSFIHEVLEDIYRNLSHNKQLVTIDKIKEQIAEIPQLVTAKFKQNTYKDFILTGTNYINQQIVIEYVSNFLLQQIEESKIANSSFEIIALENITKQKELKKEYKPLLSVAFETTINNKKVEITIQGITDRIDKFNQQIRIIDYKTGNVEERELKINEQDLHTLTHDHTLAKARQLWIYKYILAKKVLAKKEGYQLGDYLIAPEEDIRAGIYTLQKPDNNFMELQIKTQNADAEINHNLQTYVQVSEDLLNQIIQDMANPHKSITQTEEIKVCELCAYNNICRR